MLKICIILVAFCTLSSTHPAVTNNNDSWSIPPPISQSTTTALPTTNMTTQSPTLPPTTSPETPTTTNTTTTTPKPTVKPTTIKTTTVEPGPTTSTQKPTSPTPTSGTTKAAIVTTTAVPDSHSGTSRHFDGLSFMGGIILTVGATGLATLGYKIYRIRTERTYHNF